MSTTNADGASPMSPMRDDVLGATRRLTDGVLARRRHRCPTWSWAATDGRSLRQAGIPTYGVQGIFYDAADIRFHGRDERVGVREFYEGQEFLYRLVKELSH